MLLAAALILLTALLVYMVIYHSERQDVRVAADEFIIGIREPARREIDKCIRRLQITNKRLLSRGEVDRGRIQRLRSLLDDTVTSPP